MTDDKAALRELLEKGSDATFLRETIAFAAQRLMELATEALTGAAHGEKTRGRLVQRNGYRDRDWETGPGPWNCASRSCARAPISPPSWSPGARRDSSGRRHHGAYAVTDTSARSACSRHGRP